MKIQEMVFTLVALMIFFAMVGMIYFSINVVGLREKVQELRDKEARESIKKISGMAEFTFTPTTDCTSCIDLDKVIFMKSNRAYEELWSFDYLVIEILDSKLPNQECTAANYPDCNKVTLIKKTGDFGAASGAFVALARWDPNIGWFRYELGKIYASGENIGS